MENLFDNEFLRRDSALKDMGQGMCFGTEAARFADVLKEYISGEFRDFEYYRILAKKADSQKKKQTILNISADEIRHARKLATAYFLSTGNNYYPYREEFMAMKVPPFRIALRERFKEEYASAAKYDKTAGETHDVCLRELLNGLSADEKQHAIMLQQMIEESIR